MTNKEIMNMYDGLQNAKQDRNFNFPAKTTFAIVKNLKLIEPIVEALIQAKNQILSELGTESEQNPGEFYIPPANRAELAKQMETIDNIDNEVALHKIKWEDIEDFNLSIQAMEALYPMIEEEN